MDLMPMILLFFFLVSVSSVSHAGLQAEVYWKSVFPNSPMPSAIRARIAPDIVGDNKAGAHGVRVNTWHNKGKPIIVNVSPFYYIYGATNTQLHDDPRVTLFFLEKDLHPGAKMKLNFTDVTYPASFISREEAESIPFSSSKLDEILAHLGVQPNSQEAELMKRTLEECEQKAVPGERKQCLTSLESMVEFSTESLGTRDVKAVSTEVGKEASGELEFRIKKSGIERMKGGELVACHLQEYRYAVFYCHFTRKSRAYTVKMVANNGADVKAAVVCHLDTGSWNPKHVAFQVLGVKPGTVPVCHFLPQDHVVWGPMI